MQVNIVCRALFLIVIHQLPFFLLGSSHWWAFECIQTMKADSWSCLVILLVWWQLLGPLYGRSDKSKSGHSPVLSAISANNSSKNAAWSNEQAMIDDVQVGCRELRAKRYISDGFCTSMKAIKEVVCAGNCLPIRQLPWYSEFVKYWSKDKLKEWQCEEDIVRRKKVRLYCGDGTYRTYKIKVVKSCKCKKTLDQHNRTKRKDRRRKRRKHRRNRKDKKNNSQNNSSV